MDEDYKLIMRSSPTFRQIVERVFIEGSEKREQVIYEWEKGGCVGKIPSFNVSFEITEDDVKQIYEELESAGSLEAD